MCDCRYLVSTVTQKEKKWLDLDVVIRLFKIAKNQWHSMTSRLSFSDENSDFMSQFPVPFQETSQILLKVVILSVKEGNNRIIVLKELCQCQCGECALSVC